MLTVATRVFSMKGLIGIVLVVWIAASEVAADRRPEDVRRRSHESSAALAPVSITRMLRSQAGIDQASTFEERSNLLGIDACLDGIYAKIKEVIEGSTQRLWWLKQKTMTDDIGTQQIPKTMLDVTDISRTESEEAEILRMRYMQFEAWWKEKTSLKAVQKILQDRLVDESNSAIDRMVDKYKQFLEQTKVSGMESVKAEKWYQRKVQFEKWSNEGVTVENAKTLLKNGGKHKSDNAIELIVLQYKRFLGETEVIGRKNANTWGWYKLQFEEWSEEGVTLEQVTSLLQSTAKHESDSAIGRTVHQYENFLDDTKVSSTESEKAEIWYWRKLLFEEWSNKGVTVEIVKTVLKNGGEDESAIDRTVSQYIYFLDTMEVSGWESEQAAILNGRKLQFEEWLKHGVTVEKIKSLLQGIGEHESDSVIAQIALQYEKYIEEVEDAAILPFRKLQFKAWSKQGVTVEQAEILLQARGDREIQSDIPLIVHQYKKFLDKPRFSALDSVKVEKWFWRKLQFAKWSKEGVTEENAKTLLKNGGEPESDSTIDRIALQYKRYLGETEVNGRESKEAEKWYWQKLQFEEWSKEKATPETVKSLLQGRAKHESDSAIGRTVHYYKNFLDETWASSTESGNAEKLQFEKWPNEGVTVENAKTLLKNGGEHESDNAIDHIALQNEKFLGESGRESDNALAWQKLQFKEWSEEGGTLEQVKSLLQDRVKNESASAISRIMYLYEKFVVKSKVPMDYPSTSKEVKRDVSS